ASGSRASAPSARATRRGRGSSAAARPSGGGSSGSRSSRVLAISDHFPSPHPLPLVADFLDGQAVEEIELALELPNARVLEHRHAGTLDGRSVGAIPRRAVPPLRDDAIAVDRDPVVGVRPAAVGLHVALE